MDIVYRQYLHNNYMKLLNAFLFPYQFTYDP